MHKITEPLKWRKPRMVFVGSMTDIFHPDYSDDFILEIYASMMKCRTSIFQVLTKRILRMMHFTNHYFGQWGYVPENIWHGATIENQARANERIPYLLETKTTVRFISCEPLLGKIDFKNLKRPEMFHRQPRGWESWFGQKIHWVIVGGETGPGARECREEWIASVYEQCKAAGVPFFFKQTGKKWEPIIPWQGFDKWLNGETLL
jgi:protein gp37